MCAHGISRFVYQGMKKPDHISVGLDNVVD